NHQNKSMKNIMKVFRLAPAFLLSLSFFTTVGLANAQTNSAAKTNRWERDIQAFEISDRTNPPPMNAVLFTGASNIRLWKNVGEAFPGHKVFNRGFGGAEMSD